jgi:hypothetical protein
MELVVRAYHDRVNLRIQVSRRGVIDQSSTTTGESFGPTKSPAMRSERERWIEQDVLLSGV